MESGAQPEQPPGPRWRRLTSFESCRRAHAGIARDIVLGRLDRRSGAIMIQAVNGAMAALAHRMAFELNVEAEAMRRKAEALAKGGGARA